MIVNHLEYRHSYLTPHHIDNDTYILCICMYSRLKKITTGNCLGIFSCRKIGGDSNLIPICSHNSGYYCISRPHWTLYEKSILIVISSEKKYHIIHVGKPENIKSFMSQGGLEKIGHVQNK